MIENCKNAPSPYLNPRVLKIGGRPFQKNQASFWRSALPWVGCEKHEIDIALKGHKKCGFKEKPEYTMLRQISAIPLSGVLSEWHLRSLIKRKGTLSRSHIGNTDCTVGFLNSCPLTKCKFNPSCQNSRQNYDDGQPNCHFVFVSNDFFAFLAS